MARIEEDLDGGLWTAMDPAFLQKGQLSALQNAIYIGGSQALQRAKGRTAFGTVSATGVDVNGLRDIEFDNGDHYLFAIASNVISTAVVGDTGTFSSATSLATTAASLEVAHYLNRFYLLNGTIASASAIDTNLVAYLTATAAGNTLQLRQHGMLPVIAAPATASSTALFSQTVSGYYEYWTTEVARIQQDGATLVLESAFASDTNPTTVYISTTASAVTIFMPTIRNTITTHWRIYRSPKKDKESDRKFPSGFMISEALATGVSAVTAVTDSLTVLSATGFPISFNGTAPFADFAVPSGASAAGGTVASATAVIFTTKAQANYGWNFGGFAGSVRGIKVELTGYIASGSAQPIPVTVTIGRRNPADGGFALLGSNNIPFGLGLPRTASKSAIITATGSGAMQTISLGGQNDRWFASDSLALADSEFDSNFMAVYSFRGAVLSPNQVLAVDYLKTTVYYSATIDGTVQYPSVVYTFGDITSQVSKNHPPPSANTGDLFEDSLVLNDMSNPPLIRWSAPGDVEYFPPTYYLDFETRENDRVRLIKVVNSQLVVALDSSLWRINYLPSERDASFDRGKAMVPISRTYGCVGPMCACTFSPDGDTELLAFVGSHGVHVTDGYRFDTYTDGLDWRGVISETSTSTPIALVNDRERQELVFYYRNDALGNETYKALHFSYSSDHMVNGKPKVSGPVNMRNFDSGSSTRADLKSAWTLQRSNGVTNVYLGYGGTATAAGAGKVYRETGTTIPAEDSTMSYVTRRMYQAGFANEWKLDTMYGYCGTYTAPATASYTILNSKTDGNAEDTLSAKTKTLGGQKLHRVQFSQGLEGARVSAIVTGTTFTQERLIFEGQGFGEEDSGR